MNDIPYSIKGFDHCELYVGNAKQTAFYYNQTMGFKTIAYQGLETGCRDKVSYVLNQGRIFLVVTSPLEKNTEIGHHIDRHGDGIKDIAFTDDDAEKEKGLRSKDNNIYKFCPACGNGNEDNYKFCINCGNDLQY